MLFADWQSFASRKKLCFGMLLGCCVPNGYAQAQALQNGPSTVAPQQRGDLPAVPARLPVFSSDPGRQSTTLGNNANATTGNSGPTVRFTSQFQPSPQESVNPQNLGQDASQGLGQRVGPAVLPNDQPSGQRGDMPNLPRMQQPQNADQTNVPTAEERAARSPSGAAAPGAGDRQSAEDAQADMLTLADVVASVYQSYPVIQQARLGAPIAGGDLLAAYGTYDLKVYGQSLSEPVGFYRNYRQSIGLARQLWWGGYVSAGYRIGRGEFAPWYQERVTDDDGEFKLSLLQPLLQGYAIDPGRVAVFQADLTQQQVGPEIQQTVLMTSLDAARNYWTWVATGKVLEARRDLLELAVRRGGQFEDLVKSGAAPAVDIVFNQQLIAERRLEVIKTQQKFRETTLKLAVFLRDDAGQMLLPSDDWLPPRFPIIESLPPADFQADLANALTRRPELQILNLEVQKRQWDVELGRNQTLPQLDMILEASQDAGAPSSSSNDKGRFELLFGVQGELPIQRRKARGKIQSSQGKIAQINQKLRLQRDKIATELQIANNALMLAEESLEQAKAGLLAAIDTLDRYRFGFDKGYVDLLYINILETKAAESEIKLIEAQQRWFDALALMQAALGLDPIDRAIAVSELPLGDDLSIHRLLETLKDRELPESEQVLPRNIPRNRQNQGAGQIP